MPISIASPQPTPRPGPLKIIVLGLLQIISWGGSFYLLGVLGNPIAESTGWSHQAVLAGASIGLLVAGLLAPLCGRLIARLGGRVVLCGHGLFLSAGLVLMALAPSLPVYWLAWIILGVAMAGGLYDALFTSLGATYGLGARPIIVGVTLISGFCTTVIWPLLAVMVHSLGWRWTCAVYALVALLSLYPLYRYALPGPAPRSEANASAQATSQPLRPAIYWAMTIMFALAAALMTCLTLVLITVLQARGLSLSSAIALGAMIGPAQVLCRVIDLVAKRQAPLTTALMSSGFSFVGLALVDFAPAAVALGLVCYGAGNGLRAIVKSTLPLLVVKPGDYAAVAGRMARPALIAQAAAPVACGYVLSHWGAEVMIHAMVALALAAWALSLWLARLIAQAGQAVP